MCCMRWAWVFYKTPPIKKKKKKPNGFSWYTNNVKLPVDGALIFGTLAQQVKIQTEAKYIHPGCIRGIACIWDQWPDPDVS